MPKGHQTETFKLWAIIPPHGWDDDFKARDTLSPSADSAWDRFTYPALNRKAYEEDGFKAVQVDITITLSPGTN